MIDSEYIPHLRHKLNGARREICRQSLWAFARNYLGGEFFKLPPSTMHTEISSLLAGASVKRGISICYDKEVFIMLIADTKERAAELLDIIKEELVLNSKLLTDFPDSTGKPPKHWQSNCIITRNKIKVVAHSLKQKNYISKYKCYGPSLVIFDNIDESIDFIRRLQTQKNKRFEELVERYSNQQSNIVTVGTIFNRDSTLAEILMHSRKHDWTFKKYQALLSWADNDDLWKIWGYIYQEASKYYNNSGPESARKFFNDNMEDMLKGTEVLWPEHEDYYKLMVYKLDQGEKSFACERQNYPPDLRAHQERLQRMREELRLLQAQLEEEDKRNQS
jgi:hypothetical protein